MGTDIAVIGAVVEIVRENQILRDRVQRLEAVNVELQGRIETLRARARNLEAELAQFASVEEPEASGAGR